ncbi:hypothetical protein BZA05DRAFT_434112 [Tricharina praecox]|uniref:uncharacterized protein n=1 Tax=Tricharina praecox TaxID=43433 RepID=UPI002220A019|nr:uncharacterized protein BZA05DRAFT_434112 [Tricharina praecox]KAI5856592.1 hypothetical protein BZA05DRAFT_434112 [Tricharina praecox]
MGIGEVYPPSWSTAVANYCDAHAAKAVRSRLFSIADDWIPAQDDMSAVFQISKMMLLVSLHLSEGRRWGTNHLVMGEELRPVKCGSATGSGKTVTLSLPKKIHSVGIPQPEPIKVGPLSITNSLKTHMKKGQVFKIGTGEVCSNETRIPKTECIDDDFKFIARRRKVEYDVFGVHPKFADIRRWHNFLSRLRYLYAQNDTILDSKTIDQSNSQALLSIAPQHCSNVHSARLQDRLLVQTTQLIQKLEQDAIEDIKLQMLEGFIALLEFATSWVARWQRDEKCEKMVKAAKFSANM